MGKRDFWGLLSRFFFRLGFPIKALFFLVILGFLFYATTIPLWGEESLPLGQKAFRNSLPKNLLEWLEGRENRPLRVGVLRSWAPFTMEAGGEVRGFAWTYLESLASLMGLSLEPVPEDSWKELVRSIREREVDLIPGIWKIPEREKVLFFTNSYFESLILLACSRDLAPATLSDLPIPLAVVPEYGTTKVLETLYSTDALLYVSSPLEALKAISRGEASGYLDQREVLEYLVRHFFFPELALRYLEDFPAASLGKLHMAIREDWPELGAILNRAMQAIPEEDRDSLLPRELSFSLEVRSPPSLTTEETRWIQEHGAIGVFPIKSHLPPFWEISPQGIPRGYAVQMLQEMQRSMKIPMIAAPGDSSDGPEALRKGMADLLPLIQPLHAQSEGLLYSAPYLSIPHVMVVRDPRREIRSLSDTKDMVVAVDASPYFRNLFSRGHPFSEKREYPSAREALLGVSRGEAELYIGNFATVSSIIKEEGIRNLRIFSDETLPPLFLSFGVPPGEDILEEMLNKYIGKIEESQKYAALQGDYDYSTVQEFRLFPYEREWLKSVEPLRIGIDPDWPPLEFLGESGTHEGIISDYLALLRKDLQIDMEYVGTLSWKDTMERAQRGEVDLVPGLNDLPERREFLAFTDPYLSMPLVIAARTDGDYIGGLRSLRGKTAGLVAGYAVNAILLREYPEIRFEIFPDIQAALKALHRREIHGVIQSNLVLSYYIKFLGLGSLQIAAPTPYADLLSMGVRRDLAPLVPILNRLLASITVNEKELILDKWITRPIPGYVNWQRVWSIFFGVFGVGFLFVIFMLFWNRRLAAEVMERQRVEIKLEEQKIRAESANRAKSVFLANMSHEIRTPLNAILGYAQLMKRDPALSGHQREFVETIKKSGDHLLQLITDILEMSKIEAGRVDLEEKPFDLHGMISQMEGIFLPEVERREILLEVRRSSEIPSYLLGDEKKVRQVLLNILGNAVKFSSRGKILFEVESESPGVRQRQIFFKIWDSGPGVPEGELEKIFEPFEQTREGIDKGGTGLGLPISRHYARLMGGDLALTNVPGGGALCVFTFRGDEVPGLEEDTSYELPHLPVLQLLSSETPPLLLVVDDRKSNRDLLRHLLENVGFQVEEAADGIEAMQYLEHELPGGILLDRRMPHMDGLEVLRRVKEHPEMAHIPVIMVSASVLEEDCHEVLRMGADAFIRKPFREEELFETLGRLLNLRYAYGNAAEEEMPLPSEQKELSPREEKEPLGKLSPQVAEGFSKALESGEVSRLEDLIEREIAPGNPKMADTLIKLLRRYEYEEMRRLVEEAISRGKAPK